MNFDIYCDESCQEVFKDPKAHKYMILGGLWMPLDFRDEFKKNIKQYKLEHKYFSEIKWNKVAPSSLNFYKSIINYFFTEDNLRFRAITIESSKIDFVKFSEGDAELNFYKFYYQLIHLWLLDFNVYNIFLDYKINKERSRIKDLKRVLGLSNISSEIKNVQSLPSKESLGIQLADLLIGSISGKFNSELTSKAKIDIINSIEKHLGKPIEPTPKFKEKFNVFNINLRGGW